MPIAGLDEQRRMRAVSNATTCAITSTSNSVALSAGVYEVFNESASSSIVYYKAGANTSVTVTVASALPIAPGTFGVRPLQIASGEDAYVAGIVRSGTAILYFYRFE